MKKCEDIENDLPFYLDGSLSDADKKIVEEHLNTCPRCSKALVELSRTGSLLGNLPEVEPPPWFKQKIMAGVREEAGKKSLMRKLFCPLRIKIPVQVMATIFIAVLAVYSYRAGEDRMKEVMPSSAPAPVMEIPQKQLPEQEVNTSAAEVKKERQAAQVKGMLRSDALEKKTDAAKPMNDQVLPAAKATPYANAPAAKSVAAPSAEPKYREEKDFSGASVSMKESKILRMQSAAPRPAVYLRVNDIVASMMEAEKLLTKYEAKNISRQVSQGKAVLTAEIKTRKIRDLLAQLKTIGQIDGNMLVPDTAEENTFLVIEFSNQ